MRRATITVAVTPAPELRLERTRHAIFFEGKVMLGEPELGRTVNGACH